LIPLLARQGLRTGIIKHAHHDAGPTPVLGLNNPTPSPPSSSLNQRIDKTSFVVFVTYPAIQGDDLSPFSRLFISRPTGLHD
jgi:hypothetical protein